MPLQVEKDFRGITIPAAYLRITGFQWRNAAEVVIRVATYATQAAYEAQFPELEVETFAIQIPLSMEDLGAQPEEWQFNTTEEYEAALADWQRRAKHLTIFNEISEALYEILKLTKYPNAIDV